MKRSNAASQSPATPIPAAASTPTTPEPNIRILKTGTCHSLTGKSTLTYHIGCNDKSELLIRIHANSNKGYFSREWVAISTIQKKVLDKSTSITSHSLRQVYIGQSINNSGFLLAALKAEGLVRLKAENSRVHEALDTSRFITELKTMMKQPPSAITSTPSKKPPRTAKPELTIPTLES
ncbi:MAG: hypothetical protein AB1593_03955 [Pseudomonadota bacterium]